MKMPASQTAYDERARFSDKTLAVARIVAAAVSLASFALLGRNDAAFVDALWLVLAGCLYCFVGGAYVLRVERPHWITPLAFTVTDATLIAVLSLLTGGHHSPFAALAYVAVVLNTFRFVPRIALPIAGLYVAILLWLSYVDGSIQESPWRVPFEAAALCLTAAGAAMLSSKLQAEIEHRLAQADDTRRTAQQLERIVGSVTEGVGMIDANGRIVMANRQACQILGTNDLVGRDLHKSDLRDVTKAGKPLRHEEMANLRALATRRAVHDARVTITRPDGARATLSINAVPLLDADGKVEGAVCTFSDITDRIAAEARLAQSERRFRSLHDAVPLAVISYDGDGVITAWNSAAERMLGAPASEQLGKRCPLTAQLGADLPFVGREMEVASLDGRVVPVAASAAPLVDAAGRPAGAVVALQDMSEARRAADELERAQRAAIVNDRLSALGTLVAGVAHEINNPLWYMLLNAEMSESALAELLAEAHHDAATREQLEMLVSQQRSIVTGIERITHITASLKHFARHGNGQRRDERLNGLAESVATLTRARLRGSVELKLDLRSRASVHASGAEISQVMLNLLNNGADAMGAEGGVVTLRTYDTDDALAVFEVEDEGPGVAPEVMEKLFTPFFTTKAQGTGLGLSIAHGIVRSHGGFIRVRTPESGRGARFCVELPVAPRAASPQ